MIARWTRSHHETPRASTGRSIGSTTTSGGCRESLRSVSSSGRTQPIDGARWRGSYSSCAWSCFGFRGSFGWGAGSGAPQTRSRMGWTGVDGIQGARPTDADHKTSDYTGERLHSLPIRDRLGYCGVAPASAAIRALTPSSGRTCQTVGPKLDGGRPALVGDIDGRASEQRDRHDGDNQDRESVRRSADDVTNERDANARENRSEPRLGAPLSRHAGILTHTRVRGFAAGSSVE